jgi:hypothetical protein
MWLTRGGKIKREEGLTGRSKDQKGLFVHRKHREIRNEEKQFDFQF